MARSRRNWTPEEDAFLRAAVNGAMVQSRPLLWRELAKSVPGRSDKDCRRHWWNSLADGAAKGPWSEVEDERLVMAVQEHGTNWPQVAVAVRSRNSDQCLSHWNHVLDPDINHRDWTGEEDEQLIHAVLSYGTNWTAIAVSHTPRRTTLALKNRYSALRLRHENSKKSKDTTAGKMLCSSSGNEDSAMTTCDNGQGMDQKAQENGQEKLCQGAYADEDGNDEDGWVEEDEDVQDDCDNDCELSCVSLTTHAKEANICAPGTQMKHLPTTSPQSTVGFGTSVDYGLARASSSQHDIAHLCRENWMSDTPYFTPDESSFSVDHTSASLGSGYKDNGAIQDAGSMSTSGAAMDFSVPFSPGRSTFTKSMLGLSACGNMAGSEVGHSHAHRDISTITKDSQTTHGDTIPTYEVVIEAVCTGTELSGLMIGLAKSGLHFTVKMNPKPSEV